MNLRDRLEKGQVLVVIMGAIIGVLAMASLAIDGSMVYSDRRAVQSAADNAAMSAAAAAAMDMDFQGINYQSFICNDPDLIASMVVARDAAIARAATSGYTIVPGLTENNGVEVRCSVVDNAGLIDDYLDIHVRITSYSKTAFTRFLFPNGIANMVDAISRVRPRQSLALGNAIASLGDDCGGVDMNGSDTIVINGGGIFSNSCLDFRGETDITINVSVGGIGYVTTYAEVGHVDVNVTPEQSTTRLDPLEIPTPDCINQPQHGTLEVEGTMTIDGGRYDSINLNADDHLILNPGLYCLYGDFLSNGSQILEVNPSSPMNQGVTIYMAEGNFMLNGNTVIHLRAPAIDQPPAIKGMLLYMPPSNPGTIYLTGTEGTWFRGTVYAPTGSILIGGTADITYATEFVGGNVYINGTATITISDDASVNYTRPPLIELTR